MTLLATGPAVVEARVAGRTAAPTATSAGRRRLMLFAACALAVGAAAAIGDPGHALQADADLALLLRGMACIKALIVLAALAVLAWRFGQPIGTPLALAYTVAAALAAGAAMLVWQLSWIGMAAGAFHVGELALLLLAWRDGGVRRRLSFGRR